MTIVLEFYIIVCILLLLFDIVFLFIKNRRTKEYYPRNTSFEDTIREELEKYHQIGAFSADFTDSLKKKLSKTKNMITLMSVVNEDPETKELFREHVQAQLSEYADKSNYEQAYYTYLISTFDYSRKKVSGAFSSEFMSFLDSKSLYTFSNTMMAVYAFGETNLLLQALDKVDERSGFYHKKLLVDGLLSAKVDFQEFNERVLERFDRYTPHTQDCLLDYLRMNGHDISKLCLRLMQNEKTEEQVRYSAMRYFVKFPDDASKRAFMEILGEPEAVWVKQMLAIQGLSHYKKDGQVRSLIEKKITSPNWFVRVNAVRYMYESGLNKEQVFDILYMRDKYANESLLYQYRDDKKMTRYIIDTVQMLEQQASMGDVSGSMDAATPAGV